MPPPRSRRAAGAYDPRQVAEAIANGHAYEHVRRGEFGADPRRGGDLGIASREDFAAHIHRTMTGRRTLCFSTRHGHDVYYDRETNTLVAYDPARADKGTCFRPTAKERKFQAEFAKDVVHGGSPDRSRIKEGGYHALYRAR